MAVAHQIVHSGSEVRSGPDGPTLVEAIKTTARLVPRQVTDEIELAKLELSDKKAKVGGLATFSVIALVFLGLLVIALVVAAIAGLATILPLWLSALVISAALLVVIAMAGFVAYRKFKALLPLMPEDAWRGIRHDLGIAREGRDFDASTLEPMSKAEKKLKKEGAEIAKEKAKAEQAAKAAEQGPKASQSELVKRTAVRRDHLLSLREEMLEQADVKKLTTHVVDLAKGKASESARSAASGALSHAMETAKTRWKPLTVFAVSAAACTVFLRKLFKK